MPRLKPAKQAWASSLGRQPQAHDRFMINESHEQATLPARCGGLMRVHFARALLRRLAEYREQKMPVARVISREGWTTGVALPAA